MAALDRSASTRIWLGTMPIDLLRGLVCPEELESSVAGHDPLDGNGVKRTGRHIC